MDDTWTRCVIALGTNLGDREDTAFRALADLRAFEGFRVVAESSVYETVALGVGGPDASQPPYLNQVILVDSAWSAEKTLNALHDIENSHGRVRPAEHYANRTLDLDLITYGHEIVSTDTVTIPHPRAHQRRFVLEPWSEIEPNAEFPGKGMVKDLLASLPADAP